MASFRDLTDKIYSAIQDDDFDEAMKLGSTMNRTSDEGKDFTGVLLDLASKTQDFSIYLFVDYWVLKAESSEAHYAAALLLFVAFPWIHGAYTLAFWHMTKAIESKPNDLQLMQFAIDVWDSPDTMVDDAAIVGYLKKLIAANPSSTVYDLMLHDIEVKLKQSGPE